MLTIFFKKNNTYQWRIGEKFRVSEANLPSIREVKIDGEELQFLENKIPIVGNAQYNKTQKSLSGMNAQLLCWYIKDMK